MNIESLREMVKTDVQNDETDLNSESLKTPQLHNKYLVLFEDAKLQLEKLEFQLRSLKRDKWLYYTGKMGEEDLLDKAWGLQSTSRLSCQAYPVSDLTVVEIPKYTINQVSELT